MLALHPTQRDSDDPDAGNLTSVHDVPDAERLDSLQRQLIGQFGHIYNTAIFSCGSLNFVLIRCLIYCFFR